MTNFLLQFGHIRSNVDFVNVILISIHRLVISICYVTYNVVSRTSFLIMLFSLYLRNVEIPCFFVTRQRKCSSHKYTLFSLFPVSVYLVSDLYANYALYVVMNLWQKNYRVSIGYVKITPYVGFKISKELKELSFLPRNAIAKQLQKFPASAHPSCCRQRSDLFSFVFGLKERSSADVCYRSAH